MASPLTWPDSHGASMFVGPPGKCIKSALEPMSKAGIFHLGILKVYFNKFFWTPVIYLLQPFTPLCLANTGGEKAVKSGTLRLIH